MKGCLEVLRNKDDELNGVIAGGWIGFIYGQGLMKNTKFGPILFPVYSAVGTLGFEFLLKKSVILLHENINKQNASITP
jgi:hypothetical protein